MQADRKKSQKVIRRMTKQNFHISGNVLDLTRKRQPPKVPEKIRLINAQNQDFKDT